MSERMVPSQEKIKVVELAKDLLVAKLADEIGAKNILRPIDDQDRRMKGREAERIITGFGLRVNSVEGLRDKIVNGSDEEKRQSGVALDMLGKAVFLTMSADEDMMDVIPLGAMKIDELLPPAWKTLGEEVIKPVIKNDEVGLVLDMVDKTRLAVGSGNPLPPEVYEVAVEDLTKIVKAKIRKKDMEAMKEAVMVRAYINTEAQIMAGDGGGLTGEPTKVELVEKKVEIPTDKEGQLDYVRPILEYVENSARDTQDVQVSREAIKLHDLGMSQEISGEVRREINARLALIDCYAYMRRAGGWITPPRDGADPIVPTIGAAASKAFANKHSLERDSIAFFLRDGANGLPIADAWDLLQDANFDYERVLTEAVLQSSLSANEKSAFLDPEALKVSVDDERRGKVATNFYTDSNVERKRLVREYLVSRLGANPLEARRALELAERLTLATAETAIFNRTAMTGNDQLAEIIGLKGWRTNRERTGRTRGPQIHVNQIGGFGTSWLRFESKFEEVTSPFYAADVKVEEIGGGRYTYYFPVMVSAKWAPLKELILDREPDPKKICTRTFLQTAVDYFNKADPKDSLELRKWWVAGVLDLIATNANLEWTLRDVTRFKKLLTKTKLSEEASVFLAPRVWQGLDERFDFWRRIRKMTMKKVMADTVTSMFGGRR